MSVDVAGDSVPGSYNTLNTVSQNSAENLATSQISSVSYSSHDTPQSASAFSQALSNGRNANRMVHSTSSVTNGAHGTNSKSSSYAISVSSSSRNFDLPFLTDKQVYDEDFVVPTEAPAVKTRSGPWIGNGEAFEQNQFPSTTTRRPRPSGSRRQRPFPEIRDGGIRRTESATRPAVGEDPSPRAENNKKYFRHFDSWGTHGPLRGA